MMRIALATAAYFSDRRRGCAGADDHDSAATVLRGEIRRESSHGGVADWRVRGVPTGERAAVGARVGFHGAQAAADRFADRDADRVPDAGVRAELVDHISGAGGGWGDGGEFIAGAGLHFRRDRA